MIRYIKQKLFYREVKKQIFLAFENYEDLFAFGKKLFNTYKDAEPEVIRKEFITAIAGFAHEQAQKEKTEDNKE